MRNSDAIADVAPLAPGEVVMVGDARGAGSKPLVVASTRSGRLAVETRYLDAAGVRALQTACQRFLAAQEDDDANRRV